MHLPRRSPTLLGLAVLTLACAGSRPAEATIGPDAAGWVSPRFRDHPLAGKIWSPRTGAFVDPAALDAAAASAHYLLLGETHDNADHHLLQARLLRARAAGGRRPALVLEMIDTNQQEKVDAALARDGATAEDLAAAVEWAKSGWPPFRVYAPVVEAALAARLPIVAGNLPRTAARSLMKDGASGLPASVRERLDRVGAFPEDVLEALRQEMSDSHCGEFPITMMAPMVLAQKAKDAQLAERMASADRGDGAVLVAGRGHVRGDVGVPRFLAGGAAGETVVTVGLTEVSPEGQRPEDYRYEYGKGELPFDFVVFTAAAERPDPCEELREREKKKRAPPGATPEDGGTSL